MVDRPDIVKKELAEAEAILAAALGYRYDDEHGWATGDHTVVTLAMEVRRRGVRPVLFPHLSAADGRGQE